jgi:hypothetical protein
MQKFLCRHLCLILLHVNSYRTHQTQTNAKNANETNEKRTNASHELYEKRTIHETNARYTNERTNYTKNADERTHDTRNERTGNTRSNESLERSNPMTNDPGSTELQYSIMLLFE